MVNTKRETRTQKKSPVNLFAVDRCHTKSEKKQGRHEIKTSPAFCLFNSHRRREKERERWQLWIWILLRRWTSCNELSVCIRNASRDPELCNRGGPNPFFFLLFLFNFFSFFFLLALLSVRRRRKRFERTLSERQSRSRFVSIRPAHIYSLLRRVWSSSSGFYWVFTGFFFVFLPFSRLLAVFTFMRCLCIGDF